MEKIAVSHTNNINRFILISLLIIFTAFSCISESKANTNEQFSVLCSLEDSFAEIARQVAPGVVSIIAVQHPQRAKAEEQSDGLRDFFRRFFENNSSPYDFEVQSEFFRSSRPVTAAGSGAIVRRSGDNFYALTNYHVVEGAYHVTIGMSDGANLKGIVVGIDPITDLALIQIQSSELSDSNVLALGDSDEISVGNWALAVGSPFGFEHTLTLGVISGLHRELDEGETQYPDLIQTDAAINRGNSGGPLIDTQGQVIGINAAIASPTGGFVGIGFAIPINAANEILDDLIQDGRVVRGWLGIGIQELTPVLQEYYKVTEGVLVASVVDGGPASSGGIQAEDIITKVDGRAITDIRELQRVITNTTPDTTISIAINRQGQERNLQIKIGILPSTPKERPAPTPSIEHPGFRVGTLTAEMASRLGMREVQGVIVIEVTPGSPAEEGGLERGDIIMTLNGRQVVNRDEFMRLISNVREGGPVALKIMRQGFSRIIGFRKE